MREYIKSSFYLTLLCLLVFGHTLSAYQSDAKFERISTEYNLSHRTVTSIIEDSLGFMWIGTYDGLNRYDGYEIINFENDPQDSNSISGSVITALSPGIDKSIWIATLNNGLNKYDLIKKQFTRYNDQSANWPPLSSNRITSIWVEKNGSIWIGNNNGVLDKLNPENNTVEHFNLNFSDRTDNSILSITKDPDINVLWIGTINGELVRLNISNSLVEHFNRNSSLTSTPIRAIHFTTDKIMLVGTDGTGLFSFDRAEKTFNRWPNIKSTHAPSNQARIFSLGEDQNNRVWIGTFKDGLYRYDHEKSEFSQYKIEKSNVTSISDNRILSITAGNAKIMWFGTERGFNMYDILYEKFQYNEIDHNDPTSLEGGFIKDILFINQNELLAATNEGIKVLAYNKNGVLAPSNTGLERKLSSLKNVTSIALIPDRSIWLGTKNGLYKYSIQQNEITEFNHSDFQLNEQYITDVIVSKTGALWIAGKAGDLYMLNPDADKYDYYNLTNPNQEEDSYIHKIIECQDGIIWAAMGKEGIIKIIPLENRVEKLDLLSNKNIIKPEIYYIYEDLQGTIWAGGSTIGLMKINKNTGKAEIFTDPEGIRPKEIYSINEDTTGTIWLGIRTGVASFDKNENLFTYFNAEYWLQENSFYSDAGAITADGKVFFAGNSGINYFDPDDLSNLKHKINIYITNLQVQDKSSDSLITFSDNNEKTLNLQYTDNRIAFTFTVLDYRQAWNARYYYSLVGHDQDWTYSEGLEYLYYEEVDPGEYTFRVRGADSFGLWGTEEDLVRVIIPTPFWLTNLFKIMIGLIIFGLVFLLDRFRTKKQREQKALLASMVSQQTKQLQLKQGEIIEINKGLEDEVRSRTIDLQESNKKLVRQAQERELAEKKRAEIQAQLFESQKMESIGRLAGGIAHDFNNILAVIMGYSELLMLDVKDEKSSSSKSISAIYNNTQKAKELVSRLLGFARGGKYNPKAISMREIIQESVEAMKEMLGDYIEVEYCFTNELDICVADKYQLNQAITNLIANSIEAMLGIGKLTISTQRYFNNKDSEDSYSELEMGWYIRTSIKDTGHGIPYVILENIFEPFFTTKEFGHGAGLGLATVFGIMKNHNGEVYAVPDKKSGAEFIFLLPASELSID